MSELNRAEELASDAVAAKKRSISLIWIVPLVALAVGGWLAYKAISEKGPTITITFIHAEGLEAGKTKIKYRDVEIGVIDSITLSKDISHVMLQAKLVKGAEKYLTDKTKFWVVRARVRGGSVSGLDTLLSGAYIGIDPSTDGHPMHDFIGLEVPPVVTLGQAGRAFTLKSESLGSLDVGAPVYNSQIQVGQVVGYNFAADGKGVDINIFVDDPYHHKITANTRFWNASGIDVTLDAEGLQLHTESMITIVSGGIAFDLPQGADPGDEAQEDAVFHLYPNQQAIQEKSYTIRNYWMLLFNQSVRGLQVGAPVELHGIKIGEVVSLELEFNAESRQFVVPVLIAIEPERVRVVNKPANRQGTSKADDLLKELVEGRGLRAQLRTGSLLTGQMMVSLEFFPDLPQTTLGYLDSHPILPTVPGNLDRLQESLTKVVNKLEKIPFENIGEEIQALLTNANTTMAEFKGLATNLNKESVTLLNKMQNTMTEFEQLANSLDQDLTPQAANTLKELQQTLEELKHTVGSDSPVIYNANKAMEELSLTLNSIRDLMDTLDKSPQSLIFGKEKARNE